MRSEHADSPITLVLRNAHGLEERLEVSGPGGTVRVAVGRPGHSSGVWRIWATATKSDVYVAARALAGTLKFSLHESGDWRHQWVTKARALTFGGTEDRLLDRWERPPSGPSGWTRGLTIWIPGEDVTDNRDPERMHADVEWLPAPPPRADTESMSSWPRRTTVSFDSIRDRYARVLPRGRKCRASGYFGASTG